MTQSFSGRILSLNTSLRPSLDLVYSFRPPRPVGATVRPCTDHVAHLPFTCCLRWCAPCFVRVTIPPHTVHPFCQPNRSNSCWKGTHHVFPRPPTTILHLCCCSQELVHHNDSGFGSISRSISSSLSSLYHRHQASLVVTEFPVIVGLHCSIQSVFVLSLPLPFQFSISSHSTFPPPSTGASTLPCLMHREYRNSASHLSKQLPTFFGPSSDDVTTWPWIPVSDSIRDTSRLGYVKSVLSSRLAINAASPVPTYPPAPPAIPSAFAARWSPTHEDQLGLNAQDREDRKDRRKLYVATFYQ